MSYNYYHDTAPASTQSHYNTAHPISHAAGATHQGHRTTAAYPTFPPHAPVHTLTNGSHTGGVFSADHSRNTPSTALVPYNQAVAARNRANSNAAPRSGVPDQGRTHPSANGPSTSSHCSSSSNMPSTPLIPHNAIVVTRNRGTSNTTPNHAGRNHSSAAVTHIGNDRNSIPFPRMGTDPIHVRADSVNFHFHYHHR